MFISKCLKKCIVNFRLFISRFLDCGVFYGVNVYIGLSSWAMLFYNRNNIFYHNRPLRQISPNLLLVRTSWMTWRWSNSVWRIGLLNSHRVQLTLQGMWRKGLSPCQWIPHMRSSVNYKLWKAQTVLSQVCCIMQDQTKRLFKLREWKKY